MNAKPTKPQQTAGSMAKPYARATSTILGAVEPSPAPTGTALAGGAFTPAHRSLRRRRPRAFARRDAPRRAVDFRARPHASRSERFRAIPTIEVLRGLEKEGFFAVGARQSASRDASKTDYTRHMIRLRRLDDARQYRVGDVVCEIILRNANDGTSAYELMAGLFRIRCLNSLVAQIATIDTIKVRHSGDALEKVIDGTYRVLDRPKRCWPRRWIGAASRSIATPRPRSPRARMRCASATPTARWRRPSCRRSCSRRAARRPRRRPLDGNECRSGERHAGRSVGARARRHGPARTLAPRPRGGDARRQQHRPGREAQQGAVGSRRAHGRLARTGRVAAPRCRVHRDDACDREHEHRTTARVPSAGPFSLRRAFGRRRAR